MSNLCRIRGAMGGLKAALAEVFVALNPAYTGEYCQFSPHSIQTGVCCHIFAHCSGASSISTGLARSVNVQEEFSNSTLGRWVLSVRLSFQGFAFDLGWNAVDLGWRLGKIQTI